MRGRGPESKPCAHFPDCVGCTLIGHPYGEQLRIKQRRVQEAFASFPSLAALSVPDVIGSPRAFGYRNQAKLVVRRAPQGVLLGIYRPGSHQVVDIRECPVHHPLITTTLAGVAQVIEHFATPIYDERTHEGTLRYVVVRVSNWAKVAQVILVTGSRTLPRGRDLSRALERFRGVASVVQNINPDVGNVIFGSEWLPLSQESALIERVGDLKLKTHAGAFLQVNIPVARKLYEHVRQRAALSGTEMVVDLYCGAGALTFFLAAAAKQVFGIEESEVAVRDAKENVRLNGFHNTRFYGGDAAATLTQLAARLPRIDVLTLNPPRKGASPETRTAIVASAPMRIIYVSCDPTTLARDLDWFATSGFRTVAVQPFDMMPQTEHVECVATLERSG